VPSLTVIDTAHVGSGTAAAIAAGAAGTLVVVVTVARGTVVGVTVVVGAMVVGAMVVGAAVVDVTVDVGTGAVVVVRSVDVGSDVVDAGGSVVSTGSVEVVVVVGSEVGVTGSGGVEPAWSRPDGTSAETATNARSVRRRAAGRLIGLVADMAANATDSIRAVAVTQERRQSAVVVVDSPVVSGGRIVATVLVDGKVLVGVVTGSVAGGPVVDVTAVELVVAGSLVDVVEIVEVVDDVDGGSAAGTSPTSTSVAVSSLSPNGSVSATVPSRSTTKASESARRSDPRRAAVMVEPGGSSTSRT
jgi:hypothetical protein